jgi:hypothetical protein
MERLFVLRKLIVFTADSSSSRALGIALDPSHETALSISAIFPSTVNHKKDSDVNVIFDSFC